jgi:L-threonylcarbamoyladenylate synthase
VKTEFIKIDPLRIDNAQLDAIVKILKGDGIIAYPTDTFYGLGGNCFSERAVQRIIALKRRNPAKPMSIVIPAKEILIDLVAEIPPVYTALEREFWPGPLTVVFRASDKVPDFIRGPSQTIGIRYPDYPWLWSLVRKAGFPLTATSANLSQKSEAFDPQEIMEDFGGKINLIVDGGKTQGSKPSTVVDISSGRLVVLREGRIPASSFDVFLP